MKTKLYALLALQIGTGYLYGCGAGSEESTETSSTSQLVINEIVADASDGGNDWIELYVKEGTVDLSNFSITDDKDGREPQTLPAVTLNAGEFIVIQAIDEADEAATDGYFVTFKLGSDDAVILYENNVQVDLLDWQEGEASEGYSYGLFADGTGTAQTLSPTPGGANIELGDSALAPADLIVNNDAELRINEIVAKDSDGGFDWIELYVTGSGTINLADYTIADEDRILSSLPDVTLSQGEFYRIYATTDTVENATTVAFKLSSSDVVSLYQGDDLIDQLEWKKGQALIGKSYGRYPDGSDATHILVPTAEAVNRLADHTGLIITEVVANAVNDGMDWFELYNNSEDRIFVSDYQIIDESDDIEPIDLPDVELLAGEYLVIYATDTDPGSYFVPFGLGNNDELSLLKDDETVDYLNWDASDVPEGYSFGLKLDETGNTYGWDDDTLEPTQGADNMSAVAFDASVVKDLYINISTDNWQSILSNPEAEEYHETAITFNDVTLDSVAIRTKGGSSLRSVAQSTSDRYSFKVDINEYVDGQKFFGLKKFTLQNSFNDPSYMREVFAYDLLKEMGVATPQHAFVNVYVNNELFGLYLMVEAIDGEFLENNFSNANGDLYKPDGVGSDLVWLSGNIESYSDINLQTNEETTDNGAFLNFVSELDSGSTDVIDVDGLLRYMSVSVALSNLDSYHGTLAHNYYIYEQDNIFSLLPWDFNESFGSFNMGCRADIRELYIDEPTDGPMSEKPLIYNVFTQQANLDVYHDYLWQLIEGPLEPTAFANRVEEIADLIRPHVENDPTAFYSASQFEQNLNSTVGRFYGLTSFINYRVANIRQQLEGDIPSAGTGRGFCG